MQTKGIAWAVRTEFFSIIYVEFKPPSFEKVGSVHVYLCLVHRYFSPLKPNDTYKGSYRTANL